MSNDSTSFALGALVFETSPRVTVCPSGHWGGSGQEMGLTTALGFSAEAEVIDSVEESAADKVSERRDCSLWLMQEAGQKLQYLPKENFHQSRKQKKIRSR